MDKIGHIVNGDLELVSILKVLPGINLALDDFPVGQADDGVLVTVVKRNPFLPRFSKQSIDVCRDAKYQARG